MKGKPVHIETVHVLVGGQYGSEGKGAVAGAMVQRHDYDLLIRVAGPNAGHTTVDHNGEPRALRQVPAAGVRDHQANLYIAPGSEIDLQVLNDDIDVYDKAGAPIDGRLWVHPEATVLEERHHFAESDESFGGFGSTRKGVGAARADRLMRKALRAVDVKRTLSAMGATVGEPPDSIMAMLEGTQGYWLGSHAGMYPYCTSSDCRAVDFLAMAGATWDAAVPWVVFRSFPIRIAGASGPLDDEITWEDIGVRPEFTTVTKKMRRVGRWEPDRVEAALVNNRVGRVKPRVAMTFMDYLADNVGDQTNWAVNMLDGLIPQLGHLAYIGNGPGEGFWL